MAEFDRPDEAVLERLQLGLEREESGGGGPLGCGNGGLGVER